MMEINSQDKVYGRAIAVCMGILFLLAVEAPRGLAFMPIAIALILIGIHKWQYKTLPNVKTKAWVVVCAILLISSASLIWTDDIDESSLRVFKLFVSLPPLALFVGILKNSPKDASKYAFSLIPAPFLAGCALLFFEMISGGALQGLFTSKEIPYFQFNSPAVALVLMAFSIINRPHTKAQIAMTALAWVFLAASVALTYSQSAQLAFMLGGAVFVTLRFLPIPQFIFPWIWRSFGAAVIVTIIAWPFVAPWAYNHLADDLQSNSVMAQAAAGHRMEIWDAVSRYSLKRPLTGYGIEATRSVGQFDTGHRFAVDGATIHPHSAALQIWIEFGVIGVLIFSAVIAFLCETAARASLSNIKSQATILATACAACVPLFVAYGVWQSWWLGVLFIATAFLSMKYSKSEI